MKKAVEGKPRLLIILNRIVIGGPAADTIPLARLLKEDFNILILYGQKENDEVEQLQLLNQCKGLAIKKIRYLKKGFNVFKDVFAFFHIVAIILRFRADIIHTHGAKPGLTGRLAAWLCSVPIVIHTYHGHFFRDYFSTFISRLLVLVEKTLGKITTAAIALSKTQKSELVEVFKVLPPSKVFVIELGFEQPASNGDNSQGKAFRNKYNLQSDDVAIGIVSRIVPVKNHLFFINVVQTILFRFAKNPPAVFIVGDGEMRLEIESGLSQENISFNNAGITKTNRVVFTSWISDTSEIMNGLDIVALTSLNEGTPLSLIEAAFFNKPVISTNAGGVRDVLIDGTTGFLIEQNNSQDYCNKLSLLIENKTLRETMGNEGKKFASVQFSKAREIAAIKELYYGLLARKGLKFN